MHIFKVALVVFGICWPFQAMADILPSAEASGYFAVPPSVGAAPTFNSFSSELASATMSLYSDGTFGGPNILATGQAIAGTSNGPVGNVAFITMSMSANTFLQIWDAEADYRFSFEVLGESGEHVDLATDFSIQGIGSTTGAGLAYYGTVGIGQNPQYRGIFANKNGQLTFGASCYTTGCNTYGNGSSLGNGIEFWNDTISVLTNTVYTVEMNVGITETVGNGMNASAGATIFASGTVHPTASFDTSRYSLVFSNGVSQIENLGLSPLAALPEPASWAMMLLGFGLIGGRLRGRRDASVSFVG